MAWSDRLREAAYTSPRGTRITFDYEDVSREVTKRGTAFGFPRVNGGYVQTRGFGSRRYPLRCFFWGHDCDIRAQEFEQELLANGVGQLEHPIYGTFKAVPLGDITRRDDLKTAANQVVVEVTFWTTTELVYPNVQNHPQSEIHSAIHGVGEAAQEDFSDRCDVSGALPQAVAKSAIREQLRRCNGGLINLVATADVSFRAFVDLQAAISLGLDVAITNPVAIAKQVMELVKLPAQAAGDIIEALEALFGLQTSVTDSVPPMGSSPTTAVKSIKGRRLNQFHVANLFATATVNAAVATAVAYPYRTKPQALTASDLVVQQFETLRTWQEARYGEFAQAGVLNPKVSAISTAEVDTGRSYQAVQKAVALTAGFLVDASFTLLPERRIVLDRDRTILDLASELYGKIDNDTLDFITDTNDLSGSELLELPRGRSIVYYV